jgi:hypothetical protein
MNTNLLNVLKQIVSRYDQETLTDAWWVKALLADLAAGEPKPQKNALIASLEQGFAALLQNVPANERGQAKTKLAERLNREEGLDRALCTDTLDLLEAALFGGVSVMPPNTYYLSVNYPQIGPFTLEQVKGMIGGGHVSQEYWIRAVSDSNWMPVTALSELKALFANVSTGAKSGTVPKLVVLRPQTPPQSSHDNAWEVFDYDYEYEYDYDDVFDDDLEYYDWP